MKRMAFAAFAAGALIAISANEVIAQQGLAQQGGQPTLPNFCMGWERVCLRTCPVADCRAACADRRASCDRTGVYHFNDPGPRRYSSCTDRGLVISASEKKMFRDIPGWKCP